VLCHPSDFLFEFLPFRSPRLNPDGETIVELARDHPFNSADLVNVCDYAFADKSIAKTSAGDARGRDVDSPAGMFNTIAEHVAAGKRQFDALIIAALFELCPQYWRGVADHRSLPRKLTVWLRDG
jgi:hypothetical protein